MASTLQSVSFPQAEPRYDGVSIALHWITAAAIILLFGLAQTWDFFRGQDIGRAMEALHVSVGMMLAMAIFFRIIWRFTGQQKPAPASSGLAERAASLVHIALYVLVAAEVVLGLTLAWLGRSTPTFFGLFAVPAPISLAGLDRHTVREVHEYVAWTIVILAGAHAVAALFHHYVLKDRLLRRMMPVSGTV